MGSIRKKICQQNDLALFGDYYCLKEIKTGVSFKYNSIVEEVAASDKVWNSCEDDSIIELALSND